MFKWAQDNVHAIASDEWSYKTQLEADPLIKLLIGACASEANKIYDQIQDSEDRLLQRLLKYLLPDSFHVPLPSVGIAKAKLRTPSCIISNTQNLEFTDDEKSLNFTPLFDTKLLNGNIRFIGTDSEIIEIADKPNYELKKEVQTVSRLLIGIEAPQPISSLDNIAFYVNWTGDLLEKRQLLRALANSHWTWNEQSLQRQNGFLDIHQVDWQNHFDPEKQMMQRFDSQYKSNFHLIHQSEEVLPLEMKVADVLKIWIDKNPTLEKKSGSTTAKWEGIEGNFIWLRIDLPHQIKLSDVQQHLQFSLNHFIIVNRTLQTKDDTDTYFSRSFGMEAIQIDPKNGHFHSIKNVSNQIKNESIPSMPLAQLIQQKNQTAYSFRLGGIGRMDNYNAWERLSYLLSVFRQEQRQIELAERLGDKMSLEELHETIGKFVSTQKSKQANLQKKSPPIYLFVQPGLNSAQLRVKVEYWITDGEKTNGIGIGKALKCSPPLAGLDTSSIQLVTSPVGGKNNYSTTEQVQVLQDNLYGRGRIVTAHDVKSLCHQKIGKALQNVTLNPYFETSNNVNKGAIRRAMEVALKVNNKNDPYMHQLGQEIELILQENSIGTMPYKVIIC